MGFTRSCSVAVTGSSAVSSFSIPTPQTIYRHSLLWDVTQRGHVVTYVSGRPVHPPFKGQAVRAERNIASNTQSASIRKGNNSEVLQLT